MTWPCRVTFTRPPRWATARGPEGHVGRDALGAPCRGHPHGRRRADQRRGAAEHRLGAVAVAADLQPRHEAGPEVTGAEPVGRRAAAHDSSVPGVHPLQRRVDSLGHPRQPHVQGGAQPRRPHEPGPADRRQHAGSHAREGQRPGHVGVPAPAGDDLHGDRSPHRARCRHQGGARRTCDHAAAGEPAEPHGVGSRRPGTRGGREHAAECRPSVQRGSRGGAERAGQHRGGRRRGTDGSGVAVARAGHPDAERPAQLRVGRDVRRAGGARDGGTVLQPLVADRGGRGAPRGCRRPQGGADLGEAADAGARRGAQGDVAEVDEAARPAAAGSA